MVAEAKALGYLVVVIFVGTSDVSVNIARIRDRVEQGGHDVPEEDQRRRYPRTRENIRRLLPYADAAIIFDNSTANAFELVAYGTGTDLQWSELLPDWAVSLRSQ